MEFILKPLSKIYDAITHQRNKSYDSKPFKTVKFDLPIISVGNLSVGGTGKTPFVEFLIERLKDKYSLGILSRGYGRKTKGAIIADENSTAKIIGDEPMQYHGKYKDIQVVVSELRVLGVPLFEEVDLIILDDAFQHRAIHRDLNIMLSDYNKPFFEDHVLPYGRLRERKEGAGRADIIIFTKCPSSISETSVNHYKIETNNYTNAKIFFAEIKYGDFYGLHSNKKIDITDDITLLTSIANTDPLLSYLNENKLNVSKHYKFRDHYSFTEKTIQRIENEIKEGVVLITEKDAAKLKPITKTSHLKFVVIPIEPKILFHKEEELVNLIQNGINSKEV
ncbi:tetraacyldisaccharide 4'-kinase [Flammeovirga pacifica]|uniref:Tetraacyldisaccharide 4'-kinase n=1 Tax=Flammeovirga pacifica TaxID=915059 RepID=A0A1S1YWR5_FLAPC|nr:tetraacyldisaccharide 4'-kinase [Flammeovirga pacifica]OHX65469.1 tetraacyldisaccharide 4'-kinase [Flammeovirga pacifica]